jgi:Fe-S-cluster containining protein
MAFDFDNLESEYEDDCTALDADGKTCRMYSERRDFCIEYPWDEWCERELKEMGLWEAYLA